MLKYSFFHEHFFWATFFYLILGNLQAESPLYKDRLGHFVPKNEGALPLRRFSIGFPLTEVGKQGEVGLR